MHRPTLAGHAHTDERHVAGSACLAAQPRAPCAERALRSPAAARTRVNAVSSVPSSPRAARRDRNHGVTTYIDFECLGAIAGDCHAEQGCCRAPGAPRRAVRGRGWPERAAPGHSRSAPRLRQGGAGPADRGHARNRAPPAGGAQDSAPIVSWSTFDLAVIDADEDVPAASEGLGAETPRQRAHHWAHVAPSGAALNRAADRRDRRGRARAEGLHACCRDPAPARADAATACRVGAIRARSPGRERRQIPQPETAREDRLAQAARVQPARLRGPSRRLHSRGSRAGALGRVPAHDVRGGARGTHPDPHRLEPATARGGCSRRTTSASGRSSRRGIPGSVALPAAENARRNEALAADLRRRWTLVEGQGAGDDGTAPPEASFLVLGIGREAAVASGAEVRPARNCLRHAPDRGRTRAVRAADPLKSCLL